MNGLELAANLFTIPLETVTRPGNTPPQTSGLSLRQFIGGPENAILETVYRQICDPDVVYNPIVISGPSGSGKTSLLNAFVSLRSRRQQIRNLQIVTGSDFARNFRRAIETDSVDELRSQYHRCDLFALDGLQELEKYEPAQHELAQLLDALICRNRVVLLTVSKISDMTGILTNALCSRVLSGLSISVNPPGKIARREILQVLLAIHEIALTHQQIDHLTNCTERSLPFSFLELNQLVLRLKFESEIENKPIDQHLLTSVAKQFDGELLTMAAILSTVAKYFKLRMDEIRGPSRRQQLMTARSIAMYLSRLLTNESLTAIGRHFGNRDHTTVLHAIRKVASQLKENATTHLAVRELTDRLRSASATLPT